MEFEHSSQCDCRVKCKRGCHRGFVTNYKLAQTFYITRSQRSYSIGIERLSPDELKRTLVDLQIMLTPVTGDNPKEDATCPLHAGSA